MSHPLLTLFGSHPLEMTPAEGAYACLLKTFDLVKNRPAMESEDWEVFNWFWKEYDFGIDSEGSAKASAYAFEKKDETRTTRNLFRASSAVMNAEQKEAVILYIEKTLAHIGIQDSLPGRLFLKEAKQAFQ